MTVNSSGLFAKANEAVTKWNTAVAEEAMNKLVKEVLKSGNIKTSLSGRVKNNIYIYYIKKSLHK